MKFRRQAFDPQWVFTTEDTNASDDTSATYFFTCPVDMELISADVMPNGTVATNTSDYATISILKGDGEAGTPVVSATVDTASVAFAAGTNRAMTLSTTLANLFFSKGDSVGFKIVKSGSGKKITANTVILPHFKAKKER